MASSYTRRDLIAWALLSGPGDGEIDYDLPYQLSLTSARRYIRDRPALGRTKAAAERDARRAIHILEKIAACGQPSMDSRFVLPAMHGTDFSENYYETWKSASRLPERKPKPAPKPKPKPKPTPRPSGGSQMLKEWLTPVAGDVVLIQTRAPARGKTAGVQNIRETWRVARMMGGRTAASVSTTWKRALGRETVKRRFVGTHRAFALSAAFSKMSDSDIRAKFKTTFNEAGLDLARMSALTKGGASLPAK